MNSNSLVISSLMGSLTLGLLGCSQQELESGSFSAYFDDPAVAQQIMIDQPHVIDHNGNRYEITPRHRLGDHDQVIAYSVELQIGGNWELQNDDDFRTFLLDEIQPRPDEIYGIRLKDLKYSPHELHQQDTIQAFWDYLWNRPHIDFSIEEVRQLLPDEQDETLNVEVTETQTFILDWPHDDRSLKLTFIHDSSKQAVLLQSYGLE